MQPRKVPVENLSYNVRTWPGCKERRKEQNGKSTYLQQCFWCSKIQPQSFYFLSFISHLHEEGWSHKRYRVYTLKHSMDTRSYSLSLSSWATMRWVKVTWFSQWQSLHNHIIHHPCPSFGPHISRSVVKQHQCHPNLLDGPLEMGPSVLPCPLD